MDEGIAQTGSEEFFKRTLETPEGTMHVRLPLPPGPMRLAELAAGALGIDDHLIAIAERGELAEGRAVSCRKGCAACCRQLVLLSAPEAWMIADTIAGLDVERRARIEARYAAAAERLEAHGMKARLARRCASEREADELTRDYFQMKLACPFLEDEACSIYSERPALCREYLVTSPARLCDDPYAEGTGRAIAGVPVPLRLTQVLARLEAELTGGELRFIPLSMAPGWAAAHREAGERTWEARELLGRLFDLMGWQ